MLQAKAVRRLCEKCGDTQEGFARRISLSNMTVSKFERGIAVPRDATVLQKLAAAARAAALFAERYNCEAGPVRAIVDQLVRAADVSGGIGPGWYHELQARVKALVEEREQRGER